MEVTMSHCSTWHVRIDLVDDGTGITARARLVGSPAAMVGAPGETAHEGCLAGCPDIDYLTAWQPLAELSSALMDALAYEHVAHGDPASFQVAER
jgi:hypothetical protein